jgi:hypothetical protein
VQATSKLRKSVAVRAKTHVNYKDTRRLNASMAVDNLILAGRDEKEAFEQVGIKPQGIITFPVRKKDIPSVACGACPGNELHAIGDRHFIEAPPPDISPERAARMRVSAGAIVKFLVIDVPAQDFCDFDPYTLLPERWGEKMRQDAFSQAIFGIGNLNGLRRFFIKKNEAQAHGKRKPRGIQSVKPPLAAMHKMVVGALEHLLFNNKTFEARSVKHASPRNFNKRMRAFLSRFAHGHVASIDFGRFDSSLHNDIRELVENEIVSCFMRAFNYDETDIADAVERDRFKTELNLSGKYFTIHADVFGRESVDVGTSVLNYLTNIVLFLVWNWELAEKLGKDYSPDEHLTAMSEGTSDSDIMAEGDDNLLAASKRFIEDAGGPATLGVFIGEFFTSLRMVWEPGGVGATVVPHYQAFVFTRKRVEFTSKYYISVGAPIDNGMVAVPKIRKTLDAMSVSFSYSDNLNAVGYTKGVSAMINTAGCPFLYEMAHAMALIFKARDCSVNFTGKGYVESYHARLANEMSLTAMDFAVEQRRYHTNGIKSDTWVARFLSREHPLLTQGKQESLCLLGRAAVETATTDWERAWSLLGDLRAALLLCI